eukprot:TRINITY_DN3742_c0_g1_i9.p1 TRINITY_DN3742_c0_g1~~TRINITY_DN3742_c0_g1_i9.p1  ORF type:complete len:357 (-),score=43.95 TRINITY_DN3742_c0_g1_i9:294-1364(-)
MGGAAAADGMSATCWFFGLELHVSQQVPIGLIHSSYGGSAVEDWMSAEVLGDGGSATACPGAVTSSMGLPTQQYNGQIRPLLNTTIKGVVWYQGESNAGQDALYSCRFGQMMADWRARWHAGTGGGTDSNFPFGLVQIGPHQASTPGRGSDSGSNATFAIRMGQTDDFGYAPNSAWPRTFMATAFDLANPVGTKCFAGCVHIFNKQAVGHRLAVAARRSVYAEDVVGAGPVVLSALPSNDTHQTVTIRYELGGSKGIQLRGGYGFEVCYLPLNASQSWPCPDSSWVNATIIGSSADTVVVTSQHGPPPGSGNIIAGVRYGFDDMPSIFYGTGPAVFNQEGLPAAPGIWPADQLITS